MKQIISLTFLSPEYWCYHLHNATKLACQFFHVIFHWKYKHVSNLLWRFVYMLDSLPNTLHMLFHLTLRIPIEKNLYTPMFIPAQFMAAKC